MIEVDFVAQPTRTTLDVLSDIFLIGGPNEMNVAMAYITDWGLYDLISMLREKPDFSEGILKSKWLTSFDYYRTQPYALRQLVGLQNSEVRIHDARFCLDNNCMPRIPFHPKLYFVLGEERKFVVAGSGNLSRSGLSRGFEAGLSVSEETCHKKSMLSSIESLENWYFELWDKATLLNGDLIDEYADQYRSNLSKPTPTEDDLASGDSSNNALSSDALKRLRMADNFWLETKSVTINRGPDKAGNQLMLKRMSRVFFGFEPTDLSHNSEIGEVELHYKGHRGRFSMTFSDNGMDKLVLPIPDAGGPSSYDNCYIRFRRIGLRKFEITFGSSEDYEKWKAASIEVDGYFEMKSGREFGVF